MLIWFKNTD